MTKPQAKDQNGNLHKSRNIYLVLTVISVVTLLLTFFISTSGLALSTKIFCFIAVVVIYALAASGFYFRLAGKGEDSSDAGDAGADFVFDPDIEEKLSILDEANAFFSASLKPKDMFRLISSRVNEVVQFETCALFSLDDESKLNVQFATGKNANSFPKVSIGCDEGLAGKALFSEKIELDPKLRLERRALPKSLLEGLNSAVAVPLVKAGEVFSVIVLYGHDEENFEEDSIDLLEAIGERVSPLLSSSFTFEKSLSNAMTDALTDLPNERAFHLVLENQIAESQRFQTQRPLTILTFDIKDFSEFNGKYGHAAGDRILKFTSDIISSQLRKMDFLSRFKNDEFWAVIPTANAELASSVIQRIENSLIEKQFPLSDGENYAVRLNIGIATFGDDGETAKQLLQIAGLRKKQAKIDDSGSVILFPKKLVK
ncbi:MAG: GGDEF domain-containing protein [Pyrinomonadaceae bacterium]|nr:GGDEF domain-containing protein [Pyrinomonadaceae bacterium]